MESAIPHHLQVPRSEPRKAHASHTPPFPAWTARFPRLVEKVVMAYFGVQGELASRESLKVVTAKFSLDKGPGFWDLAECRDQTGAKTVVAIAYWACPDRFAEWKSSSGFDAWWKHPSRESEPVGRFLELVSPSAAEFETLFSRKGAFEGAACLASEMSDEMYEHGYWGSTRDRIPAGQTSKLEGSGVPAKQHNNGKRVTVDGRDGLCLIRSGQDWSETTEAERQKYLTEIEPVLRQGMEFLRDEGEPIGCINCRYMTVLDKAGSAPTDRTFGLAQFTDLESLETWAKSHKTHVAIFGGFMRYVQELNFDVQLKLWHEVCVVPAESQYFEYINCHELTGLLGQRDL